MKRADRWLGVVQELIRICDQVEAREETGGRELESKIRM